MVERLYNSSFSRVSGQDVSQLASMRNASADSPRGLGSLFQGPERPVSWVLSFDLCEALICSLHSLSLFQPLVVSAMTSNCLQGTHTLRISDPYLDNQVHRKERKQTCRLARRAERALALGFLAARGGRVCAIWTALSKSERW